MIPEVSLQDKIYCLKMQSDFHNEMCEDCKFYLNCDHLFQNSITEQIIKDLRLVEKYRSLLHVFEGESHASVDSNERESELTTFMRTMLNTYSLQDIIRAIDTILHEELKSTLKEEV